ncbi:hypothetical protein ACLMJK_008633 [Lecanora helva]
MCRYTQARYSCGHFHEGTAIGEGAIRVEKCTPVKVALEYWHRQTQFLPVEMTSHPPQPCPRRCPLVRPYPGARASQWMWESDDSTLAANLLALGVDDAKEAEILRLESTFGRDSMRSLRGGVAPTEHYPGNWYNIIREVHVYQQRPVRCPNLYVYNIAKGCGCPRNGQISSRCLVGWTRTELLMLRASDWNRRLPARQGIRIRYAGQHTGGVGVDQTAATDFVMPVSEIFYQVLFNPQHGLQQAHPPPAPPPPPVNLSRPRRTRSQPARAGNSSQNDGSSAGVAASMIGITQSQAPEVQVQPPPASTSTVAGPSTAETVEEVASQLDQLRMSEASLFDVQQNQ